MAKVQLAKWFAEAGFIRVETRIAARIRGAMVGNAVFSDPALKRYGTSQLALLNDNEFEGGMQNIQAAVDSTVGNARPLFRANLRLFGTTGQKPGDIGEPGR
jgi:hypothetical protein